MAYDPQALQRTRGAHQRNFAPPSPPYPALGELEPLSDELAARQLRRTPRLLDEPAIAARAEPPPTSEPEIQGAGFATLNGATQWAPVAWFNHPGYLTRIDLTTRPFGLVDGFVNVFLVAVPRPQPTAADPDPSTQAGAYQIVEQFDGSPVSRWEMGSTQDAQMNITIHPNKYLANNETAIYTRATSTNGVGGIRLTTTCHFQRALAPFDIGPIIRFPTLLGRSLRVQPYPQPRSGGLPRGVTIKVLQAGRPIATRELPLANLAPEIARMVREAAFTGKWPATIQPIW